MRIAHLAGFVPSDAPAPRTGQVRRLTRAERRAMAWLEAMEHDSAMLEAPRTGERAGIAPWGVAS